ncbi:glucokinase [Tateyamaria omphalii]|uniref:glucokinase n=1 Tax=Tateyamaria omphalii TaxID=299262 RepID=UPI001C99B68E|nr:glucokinase [Tateyamaria omphalii]MBY5935301.1 glucokinase [Tateyamaria omphalii]
MQDAGKLDQAIGLVADVGGTNTRLAFVDRDGVIADTVVKCPNADFGSFLDLATNYLDGRSVPSHVVIAVAGPVAGDKAKLTNRNWDFDAAALAAAFGADEVVLMNDLEALGQAVPTVAQDAVEPLHDGAALGGSGQALVVGLGTGFNVSAVNMESGTVFTSEQGHASLPSSVMSILREHMPDTSRFDSVENLFSGVGLLRLAHVIGVDVDSAEELAKSDDPRALEALDACTEAFSLMVRELAYSYFPRAGFYFNGSLAKFLMEPERRERVLAPLRADDSFDGQFARIPAFLFVSDTVALGGCAARLLARVS